MTMSASISSGDLLLAEDAEIAEPKRPAAVDLAVEAEPEAEPEAEQLPLVAGTAVRARWGKRGTLYDAVVVAVKSVPRKKEQVRRKGTARWYLKSRSDADLKPEKVQVQVQFEADRALAWLPLGHVTRRPVEEWRSSGHKWIDQRVISWRCPGFLLPCQKTQPWVRGVVTSWLPASADNPALFHVKHDDGECG